MTTTRDHDVAGNSLGRFADALDRLAGDPSAVNVLRYLRASEALDHGQEADSSLAAARELQHV